MSKNAWVLGAALGAMMSSIALSPVEAQSQLQAPPQAKAAAKPRGWSDQSYYLTMRDGVRLAVSLYFPDGVAPAKPAPVMFAQTRYGRAKGGGPGPGAQRDFWLKAGYVIAVVDTRGSTASFGGRPVDIGPDEVRDADEIIAHLASRPWSNGKVISWGFSYLADTADFATSRPAPGLVAGVPRETDFDAYLGLFFPGGVANDAFLNAWSEGARQDDLGRDPDAQLDCLARVGDCAKMFPTLQPVDGDEDYKLLRQALAQRGKHWGPEDYAGVTFRDEPGRNGYTMFASSPASALAGIRRERKPVQYWGPWMDGGTAEAALARFRSAPEAPAEVWITAHDHGQRKNSDPFDLARSAPFPSVDEQLKSQADFQARVLGGAKIERTINYYVMGAGVMRRTAVWPPADAATVRLHLAADASLTQAADAPAGVDRYEVDFTASTGGTTRWTAQGGPPAAYADRRGADAKLLVYTGPAMTEDMELVGNPVIDLRLASSSNDPAIFVYLEDVAPDGRVTYLTEGQLRALHRKLADPASLPYDQGLAPHSFARADALPVTPGKVMQVKFSLSPTAALIRKGHRLRVAIAGADSSMFRRYPAAGPETFLVHRGGGDGSSLDLPMRRWTPDAPSDGSRSANGVGEPRH